MTSMENNIPALNGLVLAGGKGKRLGRDKGLIKWQGKEQRYHVAARRQIFPVSGSALTPPFGIISKFPKSRM